MFADGHPRRLSYTAHPDHAMLPSQIPCMRLALRSCVSAEMLRNWVGLVSNSTEEEA